MVPKDPVILLGFLNMKLRDAYPDLDSLCEDLELDRKAVEESMEKIDYRYDAGSNQFR